MGNCCNPFGINGKRLSSRSEKKIVLLLIGLDNAGKTSAVKNLAGESADSVVPTVGFSVISLKHKGCSVTIYDLGGGPQIRDIWPRYFVDVHGVIFVVDASDTERLDEGREILETILADTKLSGKPVLLLANKQDCEGALDELDIVEKLNLEVLVNTQRCPTLVETCSTNTAAKRNKLKVDPAIHNGYVWLLNQIITDYNELNGRVLNDMANQKNLDMLAKRLRTERVKKLREERGEILDTHTSLPEDISGDPFQPISQLTKKKEIVMDQSLSTKVILVKESPRHDKLNLVSSPIVQNGLSPKHSTNQESSETRGLDENIKECASSNTEPINYNYKDSIIILVKESPHKTRLMNAVKTEGDEDDNDVVIVQAKPDNKSNNIINITGYIKEQLVLESNGIAAKKRKRAPLRRSNKTMPAPQGSFETSENDTTLTFQAVSRNRPLTPITLTSPNRLKPSTVLPPLRTPAHLPDISSTTWSLPGIRPQSATNDCAWGLDKPLDIKSTNQHDEGVQSIMM